MDGTLIIATPTLRELATATQEAVGLTQIEGGECHIFYQIPSSHHVQIRNWRGERFPLHVTSTGKLYLAGLNDKEFRQVLKQPLSQVASGTKVSLAELEQEFPKIRADGVAWTINELEDGLTSIAAPIYNQHNDFVAGLYISIPNYRVSNKMALTRQIRAAASNISTQVVK